MLSRLFGPSDAGLTGEAERMIEFFRARPPARREGRRRSPTASRSSLDAAMAFMAGPSLVLLDEPAGGVNLTMLGNLKERLVAFNAEHGTTFVVIEHNMEFVMSLCSRILVLAERQDHRRGAAGGDPLEPRRSSIPISEADDARARQALRRLRQDHHPERRVASRSTRARSPR